MNVCLISREFPPFFGGGIGTYTVQWSRALADAGHRVVVVTVSDDGQRHVESAGPVTVVRLPFIRGQDWSGPHPAIATAESTAAFKTFCGVSVFGMQIERSMPALCEEFKFDIIEAPDTGAAAWFGLNNRRNGGSWRGLPPVAITIHSPTEWIAHYNRAPLELRSQLELAAMERDCALWCDGLVCPSHALADWSSNFWRIPRERIAVVPYALGTLESVARRPVASPPNQAAAAPFNLLYVGRLEPRKGVDILLDAFAMAAERNPHLILTVAGEDTVHPSVVGRFGAQALAKLPPHLRERIRSLGRQTPEQLSALRSQADAIVVPSPMDNFPFTCMEAMAEGRLVVVSSSGGMQEMVRDGVDGLSFSPSDAATCARALDRASSMTSADRQRMATQAAARILDVCGNHQTVQRRIEHYGRTIRGAATPHPAHRDARLAIINPGNATPESIELLIEAIRANGADFARGWARTDERSVLAFSTPTLEALTREPRAAGPIIATLESLQRAGLAHLVRPVDDADAEPGKVVLCRTRDTWSLLVALTAAALRGSVVPGAVFDLAPGDRHPEDQELIQELKRTAQSLAESQRRVDSLQQELGAIHRSKGWNLLQRIYRILHILRRRQGPAGTTTIITQPVRVITAADRTPTK